MPLFSDSFTHSLSSTTTMTKCAPISSHPSSYRRLSLSHLPEELLVNVFSHLIHPSNPRHLYHLKHAIPFAFNSPHSFSLYKSFFTRISFPSTNRCYGQIADPSFLALLITLTSDTLLHLELPHVNSDPALQAVLASRPNLVSLSFFDGRFRDMYLLPEVLIQCSTLKSLTIHYVDSDTLLQLQYKYVTSKLNNLSHLTLHHIRNEQVSRVFAVLLSFSKNLKSITLSADTNSRSISCVYLFELIQKKFQCFSNLESLHLMQLPPEELRRRQQNTQYCCNTIRRLIGQMRAHAEETSAGLNLKNLRLTYKDHLIGIFDMDISQRVQFARITLEVPGLVCMTASPEIVITSLNPAAVSPNFLHECLDILQLQHVDLGGFGKNEMVRERLGRTTVNARFPDNVFKDVKKVSIFVPCIRRIHNLEIYLDIIESILPLFPQLHSFEMSIHAVFRWKMDRIRRIMHLVQAKKPRAIVLYTDDLLEPYYALRYNFDVVEKRRCNSEKLILRLGEFFTLLKSMESVKEVVVEGTSDSNVIDKYFMRMARQSELQLERLEQRQNMVMKLLQELSQMELERDIDLTTVIGWLERMVPPGLWGSHRTSGGLITGSRASVLLDQMSEGNAF